MTSPLLSDRATDAAAPRRFVPWSADCVPLTGFSWCPSMRARSEVRAHAPVTEPDEVPPIEEPDEVPWQPPTEDPPVIPEPMDPRMEAMLERFLVRWNTEKD